MLIVLVSRGNCLGQLRDGTAAGLVGAVAVRVDRGGNGLVPEDLFDVERRRSACEEQGGCRVAGGVEFDLREASLGEESVPVLCVSGRVEWFSSVVGEDVTVGVLTRIAPYQGCLDGLPSSESCN